MVYLIGTIALGTAERRAANRRFAHRLCTIELAGVITVGTLSLLIPSAFPDATVWSHYGAGYGFVPLILPVLALGWLRSHPATKRFTFTSQ